MMEIIYSDKYILKFFEDTFRDISNQPWFTTVYSYIIDSKYRTSKRLDTFLKEQLYNPHCELVKAAQELRGKSKNPDELVINVLNYVKNRIAYQSDTITFGMVEKWADAYDVWKNKHDDCDGINSLIYILARLAGISDMCLWCCIGSVKMPNGSTTGHFWAIYLSPMTGKWYSIDGTYYPDFTAIKSRVPFVFSAGKYQDTRYVFSENHILKQG